MKSNKDVAYVPSNMKKYRPNKMKRLGKWKWKESLRGRRGSSKDLTKEQTKALWTRIFNYMGEFDLLTELMILVGLDHYHINNLAYKIIKDDPSGRQIEDLEVRYGQGYCKENVMLYSYLSNTTKKESNYIRDSTV